MEKTETDFNLRFSNGTLRQAWCKSCMSEYSKARRLSKISMADFKFERAQKEQIKQDRYEALKPK